MVFTDRETPMGGYNAGFSEKAELENILPQLYERGYVLYDLNECYEMADGRMQRKEILLPAGKMPLILSVDDVAYAYGDGYARRLFVDDAGALLYEVPNPSGGVDIIADGDVMGVGRFCCRAPGLLVERAQGNDRAHRVSGSVRLPEL